MAIPPPFSFVMRQLRLLLLLLFIIAFVSNKPVVAFPHLIPRQFDNNWNFDLEKLGGQIGERLLNAADFVTTGIGALGGLATWHNFVPDRPGQQDTTATTDREPVTAPGQASEPNYDPGNPQEPPMAQIQTLSLPPPQCDLTNIFSNDCGKVLKQLIFTTGCAKLDPEQRPTATVDALNDAIFAALILVAPGQVIRSRSDHCGDLVFMAPLTAEQSRKIARMPGVLYVSSDIYFGASDESMDNPQPQPEVTEPSAKGSRLRKRDIIKQQNAPAHLQFISRNPGYQGITREYVYDSSAGAGVVVFSVGSGVTINHPEFQNNPITLDDFIFASDMPPESYPDSPISIGNDGTCLASLITGRENGVSKLAKLKPVVIDTTVGSLISAMNGIGNYLLAREGTDPGSPVLGSVMLLNVGWSNADERTTERFKDLLDFLMMRRGVVAVVPTAIDRTVSARPLNPYPGIYSLDTPLISVGAVDLSGARFSWSPKAAGQTSAPGVVRCATSVGGIGLKTHPSVAAAQVAGLAAYFIGLVPRLRSAKAVRTYLVLSSWARLPGRDLSIWNELGPAWDPPENNL